jgi:hypothetical protein
MFFFIIEIIFGYVLKIYLGWKKFKLIVLMFLYSFNTLILKIKNILIYFLKNTFKNITK